MEGGGRWPACGGRRRGGRRGDEAPRPGGGGRVASAAASLLGAPVAVGPEAARVRVHATHAARAAHAARRAAQRASAPRTPPTDAAQPGPLPPKRTPERTPEAAAVGAAAAPAGKRRRMVGIRQHLESLCQASAPSGVVAGATTVGQPGPAPSRGAAALPARVDFAPDVEEEAVVTSGPRASRRAESAEEARRAKAARDEERREKYELEKELRDSARQAQREARLEKVWAKERAWVGRMRECPTFYPSEEEFADPMAYIAKIRGEGMKYGICKVVPPFVSTVAGGEVLRRKDFRFTTKVMPLKMSRGKGRDRVLFKHSQRTYGVDEYEKLANGFAAQRFGSAGVLPARQVEYEYWKEMLREGSGGLLIEYGSDVEGTAFADVSSGEQLAGSNWNLGVLPTLPGSLLSSIYGSIPGVTVPMLYMGMLFSTFAWHVEDHNLYSINYHHIGAPKIWYGVPPSAAEDFERVVRTKVYELSGKTEGEMTRDELNEIYGKTTMFSPRLLEEAGVPCYRAVQQPGEFVLTFPRGYHGGFSAGFNIGEAVNFAMADWLGLGMDSVRRYRKMHKLPLFPHEEVVVHEALKLDKTWQAHHTEGAAGGADAGSAQPNEGTTAATQSAAATDVCYSPDDAAHVAATYVATVRGTNALRAAAVAEGHLSSPLPELAVTTPCSQCKHMCYLALVVADDHPLPICLWCDRASPPAEGARRCVLYRPETPNFEAIAKRLEAQPEVAACLPELSSAWHVPRQGCSQQEACEKTSGASFEWASIPDRVEELAPVREAASPVQDVAPSVPLPADEAATVSTDFATGAGKPVSVSAESMAAVRKQAASVQSVPAKQEETCVETASDELVTVSAGTAATAHFADILGMLCEQNDLQAAATQQQAEPALVESLEQQHETPLYVPIQVLRDPAATQPGSQPQQAPAASPQPEQAPEPQQAPAATPQPEQAPEPEQAPAAKLRRMTSAALESAGAIAPLVALLRKSRAGWQGALSPPRSLQEPTAAIGAFAALRSYESDSD